MRAIPMRFWPKAIAAAGIPSVIRPARNLADQKQLREPLGAQAIGVALSEEDRLEPEQSTSAIVVHHPQAKCFFGLSPRFRRGGPAPAPPGLAIRAAREHARADHGAFSPLRSPLC
jgi:hypothetical protein